LALCVAAATAPAGMVRADDDKPVAPKISLASNFDDFDHMLERRRVRVLAPYSRTLYFSDKGRESGLTAETVRDFETYLNKKYRKKLHNRPITVVLIPTRRDQLIPGLTQGLGDIAAGNLTETPERLSQVDFYAPASLQAVSELVLSNKATGPLASVDDLSGKSVYVRASSSYFSSLQDLNQRFASEGRPLVNVVTVDDALEDEDLMEMVDAGIIATTVVDDWKAHMWAKILPNMIVNDAAAVRTGGHVGWAFRKNSPLLQAEISGFYETERKAGVIPYRVTKYGKNVRRLQDPTGRNDWKRFQETTALFEKYGDQYNFDPLMLAAQGFQESRLDQSARGPTGAVGIMQVMPATGESLKVGDITVTEPNIHAGTKYMNQLMTSYFKDANFDEMNRTLFAFAAYNAGPGKIAKMRRIATERGLDPDVWFDNVENVVSEKIGRETTTYVRNILKYYVSYKLTLERQKEQQEAREQMAPGGN
ncbi:MAG TPA: transglycosylase SLT domain-containing protein, partial [Candidatus Krumholzibacteria bacterium]|nr:transglycosylase SLT domain-containing protein [Candidatus Krumholzibacteria bacterium]